MCARNHIQRSFLDIILKYGLSLCFLATILVNLIQLNTSYLEAITSEWEYLILKLIFFCVSQFIHLKMFTKLLVAKVFFSFIFFPLCSFISHCLHSRNSWLFQHCKTWISRLYFLPFILANQPIPSQAFSWPNPANKNHTPLKLCFPFLFLEFSFNRHIFYLPSIHRKKVLPNVLPLHKKITIFPVVSFSLLLTATNY